MKKKWWISLISVVTLLVVFGLILKDYDSHSFKLLALIVIGAFVLRLILTPMVTVIVSHYDQKKKDKEQDSNNEFKE